MANRSKAIYVSLYHFKIMSHKKPDTYKLGLFLGYMKNVLS